MRFLIARIRGLPPLAEYLIVTGGAFGWFIAASLSSFTRAPKTAVVDDNAFFALVFYEVAVLLALGGFLAVRGWRLNHLTTPPRWRCFFVGLGLAVAGFILCLIARRIFFALFPEMAVIASSSGVQAAPLSVLAVLAVCMVNSVYEEIFVTAYTIVFWAMRRSLAFAVSLSVGLRLSYHLYQGPAAIPDLVPVGLLFALYYLRTRDVWSIVMAHGTVNFISLSILSGAASAP
jgi:membrane protease YdiL (CAAX protease family)